MATWRDINGDIHHDLLPHATTNNQAEYGAVLQVLKHLRNVTSCQSYPHNACNAWLERAIIYGDSQLVIYQLSGKYKVSEAELKPLWMEALTIAKLLKDEHSVYVEFKWIPRETNNMVLGIAHRLKEPYPGLEEAMAKEKSYEENDE